MARGGSKLAAGQVIRPWAHGTFRRPQVSAPEPREIKPQDCYPLDDPEPPDQERQEMTAKLPDQGDIWVCKLGWWSGAPWDVGPTPSATPPTPATATVEQLYDSNEFSAYQELGATAVDLRGHPGRRPRRRAAAAAAAVAAGPPRLARPVLGRRSESPLARSCRVQMVGEGMRVYEAIVKGLESIGVTAAFGGAGENAAGLMIALKHSEQIRPVIARHEQAASFMACGHAMYTDQLGVCFATAGPGAFNLFSGLAVAMSDSYPVLAISGYSSLDWQGRGSLERDLRAQPHAGLAGHVRGHHQGILPAHDIADTCDVLEEAVNLAFEGRPGPVHIHVPENLTQPGVEVENYRDIRLNVAPVRPDPARVEEIAAVLAEAIEPGEPIVVLAGFGAIRSGAGGAGAAPDRAVPDPADHHPGRQGHRARGSPAVRRRVRRQRPLQRLEGLPRGQGRAGHRERAQPARHVQLPRRPVRRQGAHPDQHLRDRDRPS